MIINTFHGPEHIFTLFRKQVQCSLNFLRLSVRLYAWNNFRRAERHTIRFSLTVFEINKNDTLAHFRKYLRKKLAVVLWTHIKVTRFINVDDNLTNLQRAWILPSTYTHRLMYVTWVTPFLCRGWKRDLFISEVTFRISMVTTELSIRVTSQPGFLLS